MGKILTLNGGSSSIRFAVYDAGDSTHKLLDGKIDRIGVAGTTLTIDEYPPGTRSHKSTPVDTADRQSAVDYLMRTLDSHPFCADLVAVGHRVVHGMQHTNPERVTPELLEELKRITPYDPEHLPREVELIETVGRRYPDLVQVACFDTAFHRTMPRVATLLAIPRRYEAKGMQRYGFHGLSYTYLMAELGRVGDKAARLGRVILAHLGNGASLAAVLDGKCIDTSMGFSPSSGVVMSTRSGDLDPGVMSFLASTEAMDAVAYAAMVNHESGLMGVSETSSDVRDLLEREGEDVRAAEAVALFCYQIKKWIGSFAAALGGVETLVFAGGIGENSAAVRSRICEGLEFLGITVDPERNERGVAVISPDEVPITGRVPVVVRVIRTDEESVIAHATLRVLGAP